MILLEVLNKAMMTSPTLLSFDRVIVTATKNQFYSEVQLQKIASKKSQIIRHHPKNAENATTN